MNKELKEVLEIYVKIFKATILFYAKKYPNTKTGTDTLSNSDIVNDMKFNIDDSKLSISIYNYYSKIEQGSPVGTIVPTSDLISWVKKKKIKFRNLSVNGTVSMIQNSIHMKGISKRPIFSLAYEATSKYIDEELNKWLESITNKIIIKNLK